MNRIDELLGGKRLLVCVGPGGVGKTTLSASLGVRAAQAGRRCFVLTVDPARRLADTLGIGLGDEAREIPLAAPGTLWAAMLDTKQSYDRLIRRLALSPSRAQAILDNRVYAAFSRTVARSHAYAAVERVYEACQSDAYDLVILDTPPLRNALEILDAPGRLQRFLDSDALRTFLAPPRGALSKILPSGSKALRRVLSLLTSRRLVGELSDFFEVLLELTPAFVERADSVRRLLTGPETAFVLVCSPSATSLADALFLADGLRAREVPLQACLVNQAYVPEPFMLSRPAEREPTSQHPPALSALVRHARGRVHERNAARQAQIQRLQAKLGVPVFRLPELDQDVTDLGQLTRIAALLEP